MTFPTDLHPTSSTLWCFSDVRCRLKMELTSDHKRARNEKAQKWVMEGEQTMSAGRCKKLSMEKLFYFQAIHLADPEQQTPPVNLLLTHKRETWQCWERDYLIFVWLYDTYHSFLVSIHAQFCQNKVNPIKMQLNWKEKTWVWNRKNQIFGFLQYQSNILCWNTQTEWISPVTVAVCVQL